MTTIEQIVNALERLQKNRRDSAYVGDWDFSSNGKPTSVGDWIFSSMIEDSGHYYYMVERAGNTKPLIRLGYIPGIRENLEQLARQFHANMYPEK